MFWQRVQVSLFLLKLLTNLGIEYLHHLDYFRTKPVNILKTTILLDNGYHPDQIATALQAIYPQIMTKIRLQLAPKPNNFVGLAMAL